MVAGMTILSYSLWMSSKVSVVLVAHAKISSNDYYLDVQVSL